MTEKTEDQIVRDKRARFVLLGMAVIVVILVLGTITFMQATQPLLPIPETKSGVYVFYNDEWVGGIIEGDTLIFDNGTKIDYKEFRKIVKLD